MEDGGLNLYGFVANTPVNAIDLLGFAKGTVRYVGKSFINGVGPLGSLGNRVGLPSPPGIISVNGVDLGAILLRSLLATRFTRVWRGVFLRIAVHYDMPLPPPMTPIIPRWTNTRI